MAVFYVLRPVSEADARKGVPEMAYGMLGHWVMAKFDGDDKEPLDIYVQDNGVICNCPSPRRPCKHVAIRKALLEHVAETGTPLWRCFYLAESGTIQTMQDVVSVGWLLGRLDALGL